MPHYKTINHDGQEAARKVHPEGHHATPVSCIVYMMQWLKKEWKLEPEKVLDPAAGDLGNFGFATKWVWPKSKIAGIEIRPEADPPFYDSYRCHDFLDSRLAQANLESFDLITTNPTFNIAESVIRTAMVMLKPGGVMAMFLPVEFQMSVNRITGLHRDFPPSLIMPIAPRPGFYWYIPGKNSSGTNYRDYNWVIWQRPLRGKGWAHMTLWLPLRWKRLDQVEGEFMSSFSFLRPETSGIATWKQTEIA